MTWMNRENILLSERSKTQRDKYYDSETAPLLGWDLNPAKTQTGTRTLGLRFKSYVF